MSLTHMHACAHTHIHMCARTHTCVRTHMCAHTHTHIHTLSLCISVCLFYFCLSLTSLNSKEYKRKQVKVTPPLSFLSNLSTYPIPLPPLPVYLHPSFLSFSKQTNTHSSSSTQQFFSFFSFPFPSPLCQTNPTGPDIHSSCKGADSNLGKSVESYIPGVVCQDVSCTLLPGKDRRENKRIALFIQPTDEQQTCNQFEKNS